MKSVFIFILALVFSSIFGPVEAQTREDVVETFINGLKNCTGKAGITVGVLGIKLDDNRVSRLDSKTIRHEVEALLQVGGARLMAAAEQDEIIGELSRERRFNQQSIKEEIKKTQNVDAYIYFNISVNRQDDTKRRLTLHMIGITKESRCQSTSKTLVFQLNDEPQIVDFNNLMQDKIRSALKRHSDISAIDLRVFQVKHGYSSACSRVIEDKFRQLVLRIQEEPDNLIRNRTVKLHVTPLFDESRAEQNDATMIVQGKVGKSNKGLWISSRFVRAKSKDTIGGAYAHVSGLHCDPTPIGFGDFIKKGARINSQLLRVTVPKNVAKVGRDEADFRIWSNNATILYCWIIDSKDKSAYILTPHPKVLEKARIRAGRQKSYPIDFGFGSQIFQEVSDNIFGCFAPRGQMPKLAHDFWQKKLGRNGQGPNGVLTEGEIRRILKMMRKVPDIVEAYVSVRVVMP